MLRLLFTFIFLVACGNWSGAKAQPMSLADSVTYWDNAGEFRKALEVSQRWTKKASKEAGKESIENANALYQVAIFQFELSMPEAQQTAEEVLALRRRLYSKPNLELAKAQNLIGIIGKQKGNKELHERLCNEAAKTMQAAHLENHPFYGTVLNNLGTIYFAANHFDKALEFYLASVQAYRQNPDTTDLRYLVPKINIASIQFRRGNYEGSIKEFKEILQARARRGLEYHPDNAIALEFLIRGELEAGKFKDGEKHLAQLLNIRKETQGENSTQYANALNLLTGYFIAIGYLDKAEKFTNQAADILINLQLTQTNEYAEMLHNRGRIATLRGNHAEAIRLAREAGQKFRQLYGEGSENYLISLNNLAEDIELLGQYQLALHNYHQVLEGYDKLHMKSVFTPLNMGNVLRKMGRYAEAETQIAEAMKLAEKKYGPGSPEHILAEFRMALIFLDQDKTELAERWFLRMNDHRLTQVQKYFSMFSEKEKEEFYQKVSDDLAYFYSFCVQQAATHPAILDQLYNNQLAIKALLLNSSAKWKQRIKSSHDRKLLLKFTEWEEYRNRLNRLYQSADSTERLGIDSLEEKAALLEKELARRSDHFAELADKKTYSWKDVQAKLKPGEAAIEIIRLNKYGFFRTITDTSDPAKPVYREKGLTDTIFYVALIVKPGLLHPQMVLFENGTDLEGKYLNRYKNLIKSKANDDKSYLQFWKKIEDQIQDCRRIYLSPDGVFHQINLNTLFNPATKAFLLDEKDIRLVTVTKDLLQPRIEETENKLAYLFGHPNYYGAKTTEALATIKERKSPELQYRLDIDTTHTLVDLPGTEREMNQIEALLSDQAWEIHNYKAENALEENLKELYKPRLLHIATHGYFQTDSSRNPLLRSGLMLAGAGNSLKGSEIAEGEDGILTAYEAMNLNLDNTDLVVLSACETGLGEVKNGEGVYGLQRAFKVAGAKTLIMSLWKVNDEATQELMVRFYKHWLGSDAVGAARQTATLKAVRPSVLTATNSKRSAFLKAQKELKAKYPDPYYWGAFVMVGE